MVTAVLSVVAVREPDPVEYVDIECQPAAISVDCNNVQMVPLKLKALHRSGADAALLDVFWRLHVQSSGTEKYRSPSEDDFSVPEPEREARPTAPGLSFPGQPAG